MTEALLQFIWQYQCFSTPKLQLVSGQTLEVLSTGVANTGGGPDFLGAQLVFDNLQWRGSIEVHFKSSYWYTHQHQDDPAYDGVILHVVWEDDMEVVGPGGPLPTLCLAEFVSPEILARYTTKLTQPNLFIPCGDAVAQLPLFGSFKKQAPISFNLRHFF